MLVAISTLFFSALLASYVVIWGLLKSPLTSTFADKPDHRKVHISIVPRFGGLGIIASFLLVSLTGLMLINDSLSETLEKFWAYFLAAVVLAVFGTMDDVKAKSYKIKFLFQFGLSLILVYGLKISFEEISLFDDSINLGWGGPLLSVFWLVGVMNAMNIIDGIDGLASCVSFIGFATVAILAYAVREVEFVLLCSVLMGATAGFLPHNMSLKKKSFLGDTGSLFLGLCLGLLSIQITHFQSQSYSIFVPLLVVGYPVFDITVAMVRRFTRKTGRHNNKMSHRFFRMFLADNEHLHHKLVHWGHSHLQTTFLLSLVAATMGSVAIILSKLSFTYQILVVVYLVIAMIFLLNRLGFLGISSWFTFPRIKPNKTKLVCVVEPNEVFYHSIISFQQQELDFFKIPSQMTNQFKNQLSAIIVHNDIPQNFEYRWNIALRASEVNDCPVFVIADKTNLQEKIAIHGSIKSITMIPKPVRVPELIENIKNKINEFHKSLSRTEFDHLIQSGWTNKEITVE